MVSQKSLFISFPFQESVISRITRRCRRDMYNDALVKSSSVPHGKEKWSVIQYCDHTLLLDLPR